MSTVNIAGGAVVGPKVETAVIQNQSAAYTAALTDDLVAMTTGSSAKVVTLPLAATAGAGARLTVQKVDSGSGAVTVTCSGSDTINGSATASLASQWSTGRYMSDGVSRWFNV